MIGFVSSHAYLELNKHDLSVFHHNNIFYRELWHINRKGAKWSNGLERCTGERVVLGSNHAAANSLWNFGNSVYPDLSFGETLKAVGPFYLVSMPGEVKYPTHGVNV